MMLTNISSHLQVRLRSLTNTQGLPSHRLSIMPSQNASLAGPCRTLNTYCRRCRIMKQKNLDSPPQGMCSARSSHRELSQVLGAAVRAHGLSIEALRVYNPNT